jgi:hypothetical protein
MTYFEIRRNSFSKKFSKRLPDYTVPHSKVSDPTQAKNLKKNLKYRQTQPTYSVDFNVAEN